MGESSKVETLEKFIGWKSDDGLLEVVDFAGKNSSGRLFKVICHKCSKDKELFPLGYFISNKWNLEHGKKPCGCSKIPKWSKEQHLVLARRAGEGRFIVHGFSEEFHGQNTKLDLECLVDGNRWNTTSITSAVNNKTGCPECQNRGTAERCKLPEEDALNNCELICKEEGYKFLGFPNGYKNAYSRLEYKCPKHGKQGITYVGFYNGGHRCIKCGKERIGDMYRKPEHIAVEKCSEICKEMDYTPLGFVNGYKSNKSYFHYVCKVHGEQKITYSNFVSSGNRCAGCAKDKQKELGNGNGYFAGRKDEQDYLYVLNFNDNFHKVGRSFDVDERINEFRKPSESGIKNIKKVRLFTATHQEIYDIEQEILEELRERGFHYPTTWSTECFENECLFILNKLLDNSGLEEIDL